MLAPHVRWFPIHNICGSNGSKIRVDRMIAGVRLRVLVISSETWPDHAKRLAVLIHSAACRATGQLLPGSSADVLHASD